MALEALKRYAAEQNQATQAEIDKLLKNDALKRPTSGENGKGNIKPLVNKENVIEALQERLAGVYKEYQENIKRAGRLMTEINKGIQVGEPVYKVLLKAIECISLITGDRVFYDMNKNNLQTIYGILGEPAAIEIERREVEQRLKRLMAAYEKEKDPGAKQRIKAAIKAHEEKIKTLE
jgi:hypothetical protein